MPNKYELIYNFSLNLPVPDSNYVKDNILRNNEKFLTYNDFNNKTYIVCDNKPDDMCLWGIRFKEIQT